VTSFFASAGNQVTWRVSCEVLLLTAAYRLFGNGKLHCKRCKEYLTAVKFRTQFLLLITYRTLRHVDHPASIKSCMLEIQHT